ncbi:MAG: hypothetical protein M3Z56_04760 [Bacteroidota bacterium]|nr:hypothetical protein [Bacteroidota bacterium]
MKLFLLFCAGILLTLNFLNISIEKNPEYNHVEQYDASLLPINSLKKLTEYADSAASEKQVKNGSVQYAILVASIIRNRFYHGFSTCNFRKNWIAASSQFVVGKGLACPVDPDEILQYPFAGCSQQAIVLMACMKRKNISYRSVGFPHHYAVELMLDGCWYFFDPDMEPKINEKERLEQSWDKSADSLKKYYSLSLNHLDWGFGRSQPIKVGRINSDPATNASIFQSVTKYLSKTLWILPLMIVAYPKKKTVQKNSSLARD